MIPEIKEIFKLLLKQKEEYGFYWAVNKLQTLNVPLNWGSEKDGYQFCAWVSRKDGYFILPKLYSDWYKGIGYYQKELHRDYGIFNVSYKLGRNNNLLVSLTFTPLNY